MKRFYFFIAVLIVCLSSSVFIFAHPLHERTIKSHRSPGEPLEITSMKTNGREVSFDTPFNAENEDWFRDLSVTVKNISARPIYYTEATLLFRTINDKNIPPSLDHMYYGCDIFLGKFSLSECKLPTLNPGESMTLHLPDYEKTRDYVTKTGKPESIDIFELWIGCTIFSDDSMWYLGGMWRPDPDHPASGGEKKGKQ